MSLRVPICLRQKGKTKKEKLEGCFENQKYLRVKRCAKALLCVRTAKPPIFLPHNLKP